MDNQSTAAEKPAATEAEIRQIQTTMRAAAFGEIISLFMQSPRHSQVTLAALAKQMLPAFLTGQFVLARAQQKDQNAPAAPVGAAFWASVSEEVDQRICADVAKPIELAPDEWQSGNIVWLLDLVAPPKIAGSLTKSVREKVGKDTQIKFKVMNKEGERSIQLLD